MDLVTCTAPVNIAVIKYWGKRDEELILPINDSLSATLSSDQMHAKTTVSISSNFTEDRIWLNGNEEAMSNPRLINCLREVKRRARESGQTPEEKLAWHIHICSANNFPTAAGLASSAAGYACLVYALCQLYGVKGDLSELARQGSGSACRSVLGGFVRWQMGSEANGSDSLAHQVVGPEHWPDMRVIILVANDGQKKVPSSIGMRRSVETSALLKFRAENTVPKRIEAMEKAVRERDFASFAALTMKDSNEMHATCLDTTPPCVYMSSTSHQVSDLVHQINDHFGTPLVGYTFDAGPNACLFLLKENVPLLVTLVRHYFPTSDPTFNGDPFRNRDFDVEIPSALEKFKSLQSKLNVEVNPDGLKYAIYTKVGSGPEVLTDISDHLMDELDPVSKNSDDANSNFRLKQSLCHPELCGFEPNSKAFLFWRSALLSLALAHRCSIHSALSSLESSEGWFKPSSEFILCIIPRGPGNQPSS